MTEIPEDLKVVQFDWKRLNEVLGNKLDFQFFILNPGTLFEFEINA